MQQPEQSGVILDDEIDLREVIRTLLRYKFIILTLAVLMALAGFAYARLTYTEQYQATANLVIVKPVYQINLESRIQAVPQIPDARTLVDLVTEDDLLLAVHQDPRLAEMVGAGETFAGFPGRLSASLVGTTQLQLHATYSDPERAALIATVWAEKAVERLNFLFGIESASLEQIAVDKEAARKNWDTAQQNLQAFLPDSSVNVLQVSLDEGKHSLSRNIQKLSMIDLLISDSRLMEARLQDRNTAEILPIEDQLSLIALQQRAVEGSGLFQIQISDTNPIAGDYTVRAARERLGVLISSLQSQKVEVQSNIQDLENSISQKAADLEAAKYQIAELTVQRDLAQRAYEALAGHEEVTRLSLSQDSQLVRVSGQVVPPLSSISGRTGMKVVVGGAAGFLIGIIGVLLVHWWKSPLDDLQIKKEKSEAFPLVK